MTAADDEASLAARVRAQEHRIYPLAVRWFCEGRLRYERGLRLAGRPAAARAGAVHRRLTIERPYERSRIHSAVAGDHGGLLRRAARLPSAADAAIAPFSAHYLADWKSINVGTSDLELKQDAEPGHYLYTWTITARGIFRLYRDEVTQKSWLSISGDHVRPRKIPRRGRLDPAVNLDFDWDGGRASGTSENKPVDLKLKDGTQDVMSIQVEVMLDLKNGDLPKIFQIIDKDQLKEFNYTQRRDRQHQNGPRRTRHHHRREPAAPATTASCACGSRLHWDSCRFRPSAPATANSNSPCASKSLNALRSPPGQVFGRVTPRWPWYLPPRSLYEVSQTSSDSKNSICATPSLA